MRARAILLAAAVLGGGAAQAKDEAVGGERAADVIGGQGRGTGSGKDSTDHTVGSGEVGAQREVRRPDEPRATQRQGRRAARSEPADRKMVRLGGAPGATDVDASQSAAGSPGGSAPEHDARTSAPGAGGR